MSHYEPLQAMSGAFGNWTIRGSSVGHFAFAVHWLNARKLLWSSVCDKYGDWLISTADDTPLSEVRQMLAEGDMLDSCDIVDYGELTTCLHQVEEYREVAEKEGPKE